METAAAKQVSPDTQSTSAGVVDDFETFCEKFTATQSVRYEHFLQIWKEMRMSLIFAGRQSDQECREVCCSRLTYFLKKFCLCVAR